MSRPRPLPTPRAAAHWAAALALFAAGLVCLPAARAQSYDDRAREHARLMLKFVKDDIKKNYYDPTFRGIDLDARHKAAEEKLAQATSNGQAFGIIAQFMLELNDSHTYFVPPLRVGRVDYGWRWQMFGEEAYVTAVKPGSDAEAKGLKPGDLLHVVDGYKPTRENGWLLRYLYNTLQPRQAVKVVVQSPGAEPRQLELASKVKQGKKQLDLTSSSGFDFFELIRDSEDYDRVYAHRFHEEAGVVIWKMTQFDLDKEKVDELMGKARGAKALVLDLRGNPGGYEETMLRLIGNLFDRDVNVGEIKRRKETKPLVARTRGGDAFKGELVVLVDSDSGSAAELVARVVQVEKRGTVIGDRTAGAVMRSRGHGHQIGVDSLIFYAASVTDADVVMSDGKSLEKVGVVPDVVALPTGKALAAGQDPVLAFAAGRVGLKLDAQKAGGLFPLKWRL